MIRDYKVQVENTDHIYVNLTYSNNTDIEPNGGTQNILAKFAQQYDRGIISNPQEWNITIARFSISSDTIGRVYQEYPTTTGNTKFYVGLSYNGVYYDEPIVLPTDTLPDGKRIQVVYNINDFLDIINEGYGAAQALVTGAGGPTGPGQVIMTYEPETKLYTINVPTYYGTGTVGTTGNGIGVHMSYQLYHRFQSFSTIQNNPILYNGHDITYVRKWRGNNYTELRYPDAGTTGGYMELKQEDQWASSIMDVTRLIITTTMIPVVQEYRAQQNYLDFGGNSGNKTINTITDFLIGSDTDITNRAEHWNYTPDQYRIASLQGTTEIRQFDVQVYVATSTGEIIPVWLAPQDSMDIKFLFMKKGLTA